MTPHPTPLTPLSTPTRYLDVPGGRLAYATAVDPVAVRALILLDAFVRDVPQTALQRLSVWAVAALGARAWVAYYKSLYKTTPPADLAAYTARLTANLREPGRYNATKAMMYGSHAAVAARLGDITAPTLVMMGAKDPDFPDAAGEAQRTKEGLRGAARGAVAMVAGAGHYPHAESLTAVGPAVVAFLAQAGIAGEASRGA